MARNPRKSFAYTMCLVSALMHAICPLAHVIRGFAKDNRSAGGGINMGLFCELCLNAFSPLLGRYVDSATLAQTYSDIIGIWLTLRIKGLTLLSGNMRRCLDCTTLESALEQAYLLLVRGIAFCRESTGIELLLRRPMVSSQAALSMPVQSNTDQGRGIRRPTYLSSYKKHKGTVNQSLPYKVGKIVTTGDFYNPFSGIPNCGCKVDILQQKLK